MSGLRHGRGIIILSARLLQGHSQFRKNFICLLNVPVWNKIGWWIHMWRRPWTLQKRQRVRNKKRGLKWTERERSCFHLSAMSISPCHIETRVNRPAFCLFSFSSPVLRAALLQSLQHRCWQFVFLPTQGFSLPSPTSPFFFLLQNQHFLRKYSKKQQSDIFKVLRVAFLTSVIHWFIHLGRLG